MNDIERLVITDEEIEDNREYEEYLRTTEGK